MIPIQNIYYMLSYAFQVLNEQGYKNVATEQFHNVADLCAAILSKGITVQLKRGLGREYIEQTESRSSLRGKIEISESIRTRSILKRQLICSYDHFSLNSYMNRIIKTTMMFLLHTDIPKSRKKELRGLLLFFGDVKTLDIHNINWNVQYNRNNQTYRMLISICYLVVKVYCRQIQTEQRLMDFGRTAHVSALREVYSRILPQRTSMISANASQIPWVVDDGMVAMLPIMQSDILLTYENRILIIDAKYYSSTTQSRYDTPTIHSNNLYQIFTYVKNKDSELAGAPHVVSGMLLYARTDESIQPNHTYQMSGNKISVRTLDLNCDFSEVAAQLNRIVLEHFGIVV